MKKLIITIFIVLQAGLSYSQLLFEHFNPVTSGTSSNLNSSFVYNNVYWAAGDNGTVIKSTDIGSHWNSLPTGYNNNYYSMLNTYNNFIIVGSGGVIIRSTDQGANWTQISSGTSYALRSISPSFGDSYPIAVGDNGTIISGSGNGTTWTSLNSGTNENLNRIKFYISGLVKPGFVVGNNGTILKIVVTVFPPPPTYIITTLNSGTNATLNSLLIIDTSTVIAVGSNGTILKTTNGGINWFSINSGFTQNLNDISGSYAESFICGDNGLLLKSTNGGNNWIQMQVNSNANLNSLTLSNPYFAFGNNGTILRSYPFPNLGGITAKIKTILENNIRSYFVSSGIFDQNSSTSNAGFEWPIGSGKNAIYSTGLTIAAKVNNELRMASASYKGEYTFGLMNNGTPVNEPSLMIYSVKRGESCNNSISWANWGRMVPYGAPYKDVNNNMIYDPCIDTPGVKNAYQTIFMCLTDGYIGTHTTGEGFGGGLPPLYADVKLTIWSYSDSLLKDVQFIKWNITNKSSSQWDSVYISLVSDPDLGNGNDDYIGCDVGRKLGYCFNATNNDNVYGVAPPAVGFKILQLPVNIYSPTTDTIGFSSFSYFGNSGSAPPPCESDPNGEPLGAYNMMKGYKKDLSPWMNPTTTPYSQTKFVYSGDPETNAGWTEFKGSIQNCGGTTGNYIPVNPAGDRRLVMSISKPGFSIAPNQSYNLVMAQLIAKGTSNLNSVTKLKQYSDIIQSFYNNSVGIKKVEARIPEKYSLFQNYPNPFNPVTKIRFDIKKSVVSSQESVVTLKVFDMLGREVATLVNEQLQPGTYEVSWNASQYTSGVYFYRLQTKNFTDTKKLILLK